MSSIGPGDLCVVIKSAHPENIGKIVQVDRVMFPGEETYVDGSRLRVATWIKKTTVLVWSKGGTLTVSTHSKGEPRRNFRQCRAALCAVNNLRKLDFDTKEDEILTLVGKPVHTEPRVLVYVHKEVQS